MRTKEEEVCRRGSHSRGDGTGKEVIPSLPREHYHGEREEES